MKSIQGYKLSYNTTTDTFAVDTLNVSRTPEEISVIRQTPTGERYKQIFGSGKYRWAFSFARNTARELLTIFNNAYTAQSSYDVTLSEEQDDGSYTDYTVVINRPVYSPDVLDSSSPIDRGLTVEVLEA